MKPVRTFIAIHITSAAQGGLSELAEELFKDISGVKAVIPENIHLTLKFLGDVEMEQTCRITDCIKEAIEGIEPFTMELTEVGAFPTAGRPRVVWVGVNEISGQLQKLHKKIEMNLLDLGFPKENKKYIPHFTIGRVRRLEKNSGLPERIMEVADRSFGEEDITEIVLMMSALSSSGPTYSRLATIPLG